MERVAYINPCTGDVLAAGGKLVGSILLGRVAIDKSASGKLWLQWVSPEGRIVVSGPGAWEEMRASLSELYGCFVGLLV